MIWVDQKFVIYHYKTIHRRASKLSFRSMFLINLHKLKCVNFSQLPNEDIPSSQVRILTHFSQMILVKITLGLSILDTAEYLFNPSTNSNTNSMYDDETSLDRPQSTEACYPEIRHIITHLSVSQKQTNHGFLMR